MSFSDSARDIASPECRKRSNGDERKRSQTECGTSQDEHVARISLHLYPASRKKPIVSRDPSDPIFDETRTWGSNRAAWRTSFPAIELRAGCKRSPHWPADSSSARRRICGKKKEKEEGDRSGIDDRFQQLRLCTVTHLFFLSFFFSLVKPRFITATNSNPTRYLALHSIPPVLSPDELATARRHRAYIPQAALAPSYPHPDISATMLPPRWRYPRFLRDICSSRGLSSLTFSVSALFIFSLSLSDERVLSRIGYGRSHFFPSAARVTLLHLPRVVARLMNFPSHGFPCPPVIRRFANRRRKNPSEARGGADW
jgi:hypothetical protein